MKKKSLLLLALLSVFSMTVFASNDNCRQALNGALDQAESSLKNAPFGSRTVAILPFPGDDSALISGRLKTMLTNSGFTCVEGKEGRMIAEILEEIAWAERKDDILDPATVVKFGKLKTAQVLLYGRVRALDENSDRVYAEIELHATDIKTKEHIWGGNFVCRFYIGKDVQGIISLDHAQKMLLKKNFEAAASSIKDNAAKLSGIKTVTVVPLAGDVDNYMTGLTIEMLTGTNHMPRNPRIPSLTQARAAARDKSVGTDAVMYGAVRDLRQSAPVERAVGKKIETSRTVYADIQLHLEDTKTGDILWSKTITLSETITETRDMNAAEIKAARDEKMEAIPDNIKEDVVDNWKHYLKVILYVILGIVALIGAVVGIKAIVSYNNVR